MKATAAVARLRRLRWLLTGLYTLTTAACLVVLAAIAADIDADSRSSTLDQEVDRVATSLSRAIYYDAGVLHLEPLREDVLAASAVPVSVFTWSGETLTQRYPAVLTTPASGELVTLAEEVRQQQETVHGESGDGRTRLAAAPVWDGDRIGAMVVAAGDPAAGEQGHDALLRWLALGCTALTLLAAFAGHLLSGRSMRPAVRALDQQEQFLAEAAHELRTPLAKLQLVTDSGLREPDQGPEALHRSSRLAGEMGRLVTGLLVRARLAAGTQEVEREPLRLDQLVEQIIDEFDPGTEEVTLTAESCVVAGDPELLTQAVRNLLENAVRHGGGRVEVTVDGGRVSVRDHGPGIAEKERERMFERSVAGASGGSGIGLAIVRWVAELHDGSASLLGADGGGTVAVLVLPVLDVS